eukprot:TRINITY_DN9963_c0_g1_i1.p1 TRINITY_DN9963_c0_g1~~TRINITY_DN9963_c0_g1_i1.p1  ORF type:complete len:103 (-),score=13.77 TRINITY_DN9963_c0_g1_i1:270-578(-)
MRCISIINFAAQCFKYQHTYFVKCKWTLRCGSGKGEFSLSAQVGCTSTVNLWAQCFRYQYRILSSSAHVLPDVALRQKSEFCLSAQDEVYFNCELCCAVLQV